MHNTAASSASRHLPMLFLHCKPLPGNRALGQCGDVMHRDPVSHVLATGLIPELEQSWPQGSTTGVTSSPSTGSSSWSLRLAMPPTPTSRATRSPKATPRPSAKSSGGTVPASVYNMSALAYLGVGECVHLESLNMEANLLDGTIPESFANLRGIIMMDLSQNNLSGQIPEFIENFDDIKLLNLSFNDLEGQVPTGGIFQNASEVFVQGKYGSVYKGRFELEEHTVAVKVFKLDQLGAPRSFLAECKALRNTRHRNLVA
nr:unnamed protein product [Digitaria exilis]